MPKVSVVMPVYRTNERFLREAIESILNQTYKDFEFLILDDCPEDNRENVVKSYKDERIKYFVNDRNLGISQSRNKLIDLSKGEYLAVFDHDDVSFPDRFAKQVKYLDEHNDVGVVGSYFIFSHKNKVHKNPENTIDIERRLLEGCAISHSASMIRKSILITTGIRYEEEFSPAEDYALWCRLLGKTKFYNIPDVLLIYRKHDDQTSKKQSSIMKNQTKRILQFVRTANPKLWDLVYREAIYTIRIRLFGFIPLCKFRQKGKSINMILRCMPLIRIKTKMEN